MVKSMRRQFDPFQLIFLSIVLLYAFGLSAFGMENFDTGYIPSFSWRIVNGEVPYVDFFYKGPPATLYLHALIMKILPETAQFYWIRATVYLLFALQVFFTISGIYRLFALKTNKWAVMSLCFVFSLLNFSPYPWPTTDGLLFASAAFYILSANTNLKHGHLLVIALLCVLSALTKQSFYGVPLLFLIWVYGVAGLRKAITFAVMTGFFLCCFLVFISKTVGLHNYIAQTTGETHLFDLFFVGFHHYILIPVRWLAVLAVITVAVAFYLLKIKKTGLLVRACKIIANAFIIAALAIFFFDTQFASRLLFDGSIFILAYALLKKVYPFKTLLPLFVLLGIAWSASISLGYQFPVLFSTAMFGIITLFFEDMLLPKWRYTLMLVLTIAGLSHVWQPYREKPLPELTYSLESISPKLSGIYTSKNNFEKYTELKSLFHQYRPNVAVAPNIPMAHYLFSNKSPLPADWLLPTETGRKPILFETLLSRPDIHVLLEKSYLDGSDNGTGSPAEFSPIGWFVHTKMKKTVETQYFIIYNGLK